MINSKEEQTERSKGFEEAMQLIEAFKEMAKSVIEELIRKPAVNKTYKYYEYHARPILSTAR